MTITDRLQQIVTLLPDDGACTIPIRDLREWLDSAADVKTSKAAAAVRADLTVEQVAELMHRSTSTVRGWLARGDFPGAYKLHRRDWRIPPSSVQEFQNTQQQAESVRPRVLKRRETPARLSEWRS